MGSGRIFEDWQTNVSNEFDFVSKVGQGGFASVWKVKERSNGEIFACKIMSKTPDISKIAKREVAILRLIKQ